MTRAPRLITGGAAAAYLGASLYDWILVPRRAASAARTAATLSGKPLLNVAAGVAASSARFKLLGHDIRGDINCDIAAPEQPCTPNNVCYCDIYDLAWPDRYFGAAIASNVFGSLDHPEAALAEVGRVADVVHVVLPKPWALASILGSVGRGPNHPFGYSGEVHFDRRPLLIAEAARLGIKLVIW